MKLEAAIILELKRQIGLSVKNFDWSSTIEEWISDMVQGAMNTKAVRAPVQAAVAKAIAKDKRILAKLVSDAIRKTKV
jgi:hypothetical protein